MSMTLSTESLRKKELHSKFKENIKQLKIVCFCFCTLMFVLMNAMYSTYETFPLRSK